MRAFNINYIDYNTPIESVVEAVTEEVDGPGRLLAYRAMNGKLRTEHNIQVPRHLVYHVMQEVNPDGLEERNIQKKKKKKKQPFKSDGSLHVISLDGHDKLCGYQNWTFLLGVYGCLDTFSRKMLFDQVLFSNSDPKVIGKRYLKFLFDTNELPNKLRVEEGQKQERWQLFKSI